MGPIRKCWIYSFFIPLKIDQIAPLTLTCLERIALTHNRSLIVLSGPGITLSVSQCSLCSRCLVRLCYSLKYLEESQIVHNFLRDIKIVVSSIQKT